MTRAQLKKIYGVTVVENGYYGVNGYVRLYDMYTADGCCWDKGFRYIKGIEYECKKFDKIFLDIKEKSKNMKKLVDM